MATTTTRWWIGPRGEWLVVAQVAIFMLVIFGPPTFPHFAPWDPMIAQAASYAGIMLIAGGVCFVIAGLWALRAQITPLPYPRSDAALITTGVYAFVRHPIYTGAIFMAFGWGLVLQGWLTIGYAALLLLFFDYKSRLEEQWLCERFPDYDAYQQSVRKLIPFIY